jgi:hypothetical protein
MVWSTLLTMKNGEIAEVFGRVIGGGGGLAFRYFNPRYPWKAELRIRKIPCAIAIAAHP